MRLGLPVLDRAERLLVALFVASLPLVNPYLRGEGNGQYAYLRSLVVDGDLHFENEYRRGDPDFVASNFRRADAHLWPPMVLPNGYVRNAWTTGPAVLWLPAFLQAHLVLRTLRWGGLDVAADGHALSYRLACALSTATLAFVGLLLSYRAAARIAGTAAALGATVTVWAASSLIVYMYFLPFYPHALGAFTAGLFVWYWLLRRPFRTRVEWALWGLMGGLTFETERLTGFLLLLPLIEWLRPAVSRPASTPAPGLPAAALFGAAALAGALPGILSRWVLYGSPLRTGNLNLHFWDAPWMWKVGFASEHGLFVWTPVALLSLLGLGVLCRRDPWVGGPLLAVWSAIHYAVASYQAWHGASSFGNRFFVPLTPVFVIGLAVLLAEAHSLASRAMRERPAWLVVSLPLALLAAWNLGLMFQWGTGMIPRQGPVDFARITHNQVRAVPQRIAGFALRYLGTREAVSREQETSRPRSGE